MNCTNFLSFTLIQQNYDLNIRMEIMSRWIVDPIEIFACGLGVDVIIFAPPTGVIEGKMKHSSGGSVSLDCFESRLIRAAYSD